jgi:GT2 family glycosyltransferase
MQSIKIKKLSCIIITHDSEHIISKCLNSIIEFIEEIIVVDNGSKDNTISMCKNYKSVKIIESKNIGYGNGANLGIKNSSNKFNLVINPDATIKKNDIETIYNLIKFRDNIAIITPQLYKINEYGNIIYSNKEKLESEITYCDSIRGAVMLINKDIFLKLEGFDPNIFLFYEETDLCKRVIKSGYKLAISKHSKALHEMGKSSPNLNKYHKIKYWHTGWSQAYFTKKHLGSKKYITLIWKTLLLAIPKIFIGYFFNKKEKKIKDFYKVLGLLSFSIGISAFKKDGTGRLT